MVQKDFSLLNNECLNWRQSLHAFRDELHQLQKLLQSSNYYFLSKEKQTELEHLQNQLHIQLMNVHDLRQAVKRHDQYITYEVKPASVNKFHQVSAYHQNLYSTYTYLKGTLQELRQNLTHFLSAINN